MFYIKDTIFCVDRFFQNDLPHEYLKKSRGRKRRRTSARGRLRHSNMFEQIARKSMVIVLMGGGKRSGDGGGSRGGLLDSACSAKVLKWLREEQRKLETALNQSFEEASPISLVNSIFPGTACVTPPAVAGWGSRETLAGDDYLIIIAVRISRS